MKMKDYPCLYQLATTDISVQCDFFCSLSSIFQLTIPEIIEYSKLFAHASQGTLFNGTGLSFDLIESFGKKRLTKPFSTCKTLVSAFSNYNLKLGACQICPLSSNFKNTFLKEEQLLLSFLLQKGPNYLHILSCLQEKNFYSVCFLVTKKQLSNYLLIPFHHHLLIYLKSLSNFETLERIDLENEFAPYLHDIIRTMPQKKKSVDTIPSTLSTISFLDVMSCIKREFDILYHYPLETITESELIQCQNKITNASTFTYQPPTIKHAMSEEQNSNKNHIPVLTTSTNLSKQTTLSLPKEDTTPLDYTTWNACDILINHVIDYVINHVTNDVLSTKCIPYDTYKTFLSTTSFQDFISKEYKLLLYPSYNIGNFSSENIIDCSTNDIPSIHCFLSDTCSSTIICLEAIRFHLRNGLLFYIPLSKKFYFFDINSLSNFLHLILSTTNKVQYLSLNSIPIYDMLSSLGFHHVYIEMLPNLVSCLYELNNNVPFSILVPLFFGIKKDEKQEFYQFIMPFYEQIYHILFNQLKNCPNSNHLLTNYHKMNYFNCALASAYQLSDIVLDLKQGISGINQYYYLLYYDISMPIISHGTRYIFQFSFSEDIKETMISTLFFDILSSLYALPYSCLQYAKLLSITSSTITFFCTYDGDTFVDLILHCSRTAHQTLFHQIAIIDVQKIVY